MKTHSSKGFELYTVVPEIFEFDPGKLAHDVQVRWMLTEDSELVNFMALGDIYYLGVGPFKGLHLIPPLPLLPLFGRCKFVWEGIASFILANAVGAREYRLAHTDLPERFKHILEETLLAGTVDSIDRLWPGAYNFEGFEMCQAHFSGEV